MNAQMLAFLGIAALLTITPGADMAIVTKNALGYGRKAAFLTTLGINTGCLSWAAASALGVSAVLSASVTAFTALKLAGAAYLVWLGLRAIWHTRGRSAAFEEPALDAADRGRPGAVFYREGLLTNLLNPKIAVFYSTFLPQFIGPGDPYLLKSLLLAGIHNLIGVLWLTGYAHVVTRAGDLLRRPPVKRALDRLTGTVLIALGLRLATTTR